MYITENRLLKWGLYCNVIYILLLFLFLPDGINFLNIFITSLLLLSTIIIFFICFERRTLLKQVPKKTRIIFYLLFLWALVIIVRSFSLSIQDWLTNFGNIYTAFAWLSPLVLVLGLKIENWSLVFKAISFMFSIMIICFLLLPFLEINEEWIQLLRPICFVLLIGLNRFGSLNRLKSYAIIVIYIILNLWVSSRRVDLLFLFITFSFIIMDKLIAIQIKKILIKYIIFGFIVVLTLIFTIGYQHISNLVSQIIEFQDSRTFLFTELMQDLNVTEKFTGRGSLGTYYSEFMAGTKRYTVQILKQKWWGDSAVRITTEVGYLQMILKGGFILLTLNLIIFIKSSYVAIFKSNNKFIKRLGYYILIIAILTIIEFRPTFTPTFIILWMAIGTVSVKKYRMMTNEEINALIK